MALRKLLLIGIGAGNPDHLTVQAIDAMNRADVFFILDKASGAHELTLLRQDLLARFVTRTGYRVVTAPHPVRDSAIADYQAGVRAWHEAKADILEAMIRDELAPGQQGAILVWGDPALYDSTLRIVDAIQARGRVAFDCMVIPGITSAQALAASHRIPWNRIGQPVLLTTGRRLAQDSNETDTMVFLDDGTTLARIQGDMDIYWGAYLGTPDEITIAGPLAEVRDEILRRRQEARARKGWIMDCYLLRRR